MNWVYDVERGDGSRNIHDLSIQWEWEPETGTPFQKTTLAQKRMPNGEMARWIDPPFLETAQPFIRSGWSAV